MSQEIRQEINLDEIYQPAEDTLLLLKAALDEATSKDAAIEIGCGRALISREIAPRVKSILSTDINPHAVRLAKEFGLEAVRADLFRGITAKFDLVIFNPPYLPTIDMENIEEDIIEGWLNFALDGGTTGREIINRFIDDLESHLSPKGRALLLISSLTGLDEVMVKAKSEGLEVEVVASDRYFFERLYVIKLKIAH